MALDIKEARTDQEILACWDAVCVLNPPLKIESFIAQVRQQQKEGFHLMFIADPETQKVVSILSFRPFTMFYYGRALYIENLATLPEARGRGIAKALMDYVKKYAEDEGYDCVVVDCIVTRYSSHRFYLKNGFELKAHHFEIRDIQSKRSE